MNRYQKAAILARAAGRLSPRMTIFMARRTLRNKAAVGLPGWYRARLAAIERRVPEISRPARVSCGLREVADFYISEYADQVEIVRSGRIRLFDREVDFGSPFDIDWKRCDPEEGDHQMWRVKLAHMGFVGPMLALGKPKDHAAVAEIIGGFRASTSVTDPGAFHAYWFPYAVSHRILAVGSGFLLARYRGTLAPDVDQLVAGFLRENVAFLLDNVEHELLNNHVERNLAALSLYFSHVDDMPAAVAAMLERDIGHIVNKTILADGSQAERSPMYQGLSVASLAVMADAGFLSPALRDELAARLQLARRAFAMLCHPDGQVALFNDSWHQEVPPLSGPAAPDGRSYLGDGGYARLSGGGDLCLLDGGPLGMAWNPGHGHADFLSVEITLGGRRLIVDPGTSRYNTGADRARERSAAAHNGPVWSGHEPIEFLGCFKIGRMAEAALIPAERLPALAIGGKFRSGPGVVARAVLHYPVEGFLVADLWAAPQPGGQVSWLVPGEWQIVDEGTRFSLEQDGAQAVIEVLSPLEQGAQLAPSHWARYYGRREAATELRLHPCLTAGMRTLLCWIGHRVPPAATVQDGLALVDALRTIVAEPG